VALTRDDQARLAIAGDGEPVEWLVQMRKLPRERMLDRCLVSSVVMPHELEAVSQLLSSFYRRASPAAWSGAHSCHQLAESISNASAGLLTQSFGLPRDQLAAIARGLEAFVVAHRAELIQRVRIGRVIDAHGDLRPEHICLESPPVIIDCLEFNPDLRILGTASEMSFLAQECELLTDGWGGTSEVGQTLWRNYIRHTRDPVSTELCRFYRRYPVKSRPAADPSPRR
jgi:aminoglycoside phosphotransferase family enzyme